LKKAVISQVKRGSLAQKAGLQKGDEILQINGREIKDIIDYRFLIADEILNIRVKTKDGQERVLTIEKDFDEDLGIEFENPLIDGIMRCKNKCIFCFVDQMPKGLRPSLYIKDDDYRLSILEGTYITLTNLQDKDLDRIVSMRLSPLYISVHATDGNVRKTMLRNKAAEKIMDHLKFLKENGVFFHTQIVLCPGVNDKDVLERTLEDLFSLYPTVQSIAVVPVGITKYRKGLYPLRRFTQMEAQEITDRIEELQSENLKRFGTRLVFAADEFYEIAKKEFPPSEAYEDFPQWENGVGMVSLLRDQLTELMNAVPPSLPEKRRVKIATGVSAFRFLEKVLSPLKSVKNLEFEICPIKNDFFGESVTVAGLVTGGDLVNQLKKRLVDEKHQCHVLVPEVMLKDGEVFLDGLSVQDVEQSLHAKVAVVKIDGKDFLEKILGTDLGVRL
jgi:putative radical SAM enzyme (TIGR03279 family)